MKPEQRLRNSAQFARVRAAAPRAWPHRLLVVYVADNGLEFARVGITVSGRVGKAVVRNRVRRRLREALRAQYGRLRSSKDVLVIARAAAAAATWSELRQALDAGLRRSGATTDMGARV